MTPEQFQQFLEANERATALAIEKYVNGGIRTIRSELKSHAETDETFQKRMSPMIEVFENGNIVKMTIKKEAKEIVFWTTSLTTVGVFLYAIWHFILKIKA